MKAERPRDVPDDPVNDPGRRYFSYANSYINNHPEELKQFPLDHPLVRIPNDSRVIEAWKRLKSRGVAQGDITELIEVVARTLERWHWIEGGTQRKFVARRRALQRKLHGVAKELEKYEDTRLLGLSHVFKNVLPDNDDSEVVAFCDRYDISEVVRAMATVLEPSHFLGTFKSDGAVFRAPLQSRLNRKIKLESHLLLEAAELVKRWPLVQTRRMRFPNREIEAIVAVAAGVPVKPGTLTHIMKGKRRRYAPNK
ncbi:MAG TPA: hypothetical protein VK820_11260 [Steroidobacteraceae bacterium]|nr:hypothetical protein [Steroidobacteraceae bacterium]